MFWTIAYDDVSDACDVLAPVFDATNGVDGMSHSKCLPRSPSTAPAAREIHQAVAKSNLMVKIPATEPCVESIEAMIAEGRNINVTLIFSLGPIRQGNRRTHQRAGISCRSRDHRSLQGGLGGVVLHFARRQRGR